MSILPPPSRRAGPRFSVAEYHRLIEAGVLREGERSNCSKAGWFPKWTRNPPHDLALALTEEEIAGAYLPAGSAESSRP